MKQLFYFMKQIHSFSGKKLYMNYMGMVLVGLLESVGILLLIPLLSLIDIVQIQSEDIWITSWLSSFLSDFSLEVSLLMVLGTYFFIIVGQGFFQRKQLLANVEIQQGFSRFLRESTYKLLLQSNWSFFLKVRKSDLVNVMTTEIGRVSGGVNLFLQFLTALVFTFIQIIIALMLSVKLTIFVMLFGVFMVLCSRKLIRKSTSLGQSMVDLSQTYLAGMTDHFNGIKEIKSNSLENSQIQWNQEINQKVEHNLIQMTRVKTISQFSYKVASALLIVLFIYFSVTIFQAQSTQLLLLVFIFSRLWPKVSGIQGNLEQIGTVIPSFQRLIDLQKQCQLAKEFDDEQLFTRDKLVIKQGIQCRNIAFRYDQEKRNYALQNINLSIPLNKTTAIVGKSGAGKSTLIDLIMGLNQPEHGELLIDGQRLTQQQLALLRHSLSYIPQDPFLFNTTVRANLLLLNQQANEQEIWEALAFSEASDFVRNLPEGLDTLIGDRGIKLSGGERQRLVLARAILRKPSILVLDEATSALDYENEANIQHALDRIKGEMTIIVIAHRLSTIKNADQIVVLDEGKIVQIGGFEQLASERKGTFSTLLGKQSGPISV